jgi:hypothetical protein
MTMTRRQISRSQFAAARDYQALWTKCEAGRYGSPDPGKTRVDGGSSAADRWFTDAHRRAAHQLRALDLSVGRHYGHEGVTLVHDVLAHGHTVEAAAKSRHGTNDRDAAFWGRLFRNCLDILAYRLGYAVRLSIGVQF